MRSSCFTRHHTMMVSSEGATLAAGGEENSEDHLYLSYMQTDFCLISQTVHIVMRYKPFRVC